MFRGLFASRVFNFSGIPPRLSPPPPPQRSTLCRAFSGHSPLKTTKANVTPFSFSPSQSSFLQIQPCRTTRLCFSTITSRNKMKNTNTNTSSTASERSEFELVKKTEQFMEEARKQFENGAFEKAIQWSSKAIEVAPSGLVAPYHLRAECWLQLQTPHDVDRALNDFRSALQVSPEDPFLSWLGIAKCLALQGDWEGAIQTYDKVLGLDPTCLLALSERAEVLRSKGEFNAALNDFERLYQLSSMVVSSNSGSRSSSLSEYEEKSLLGMGAVLMQLNKPEEAYRVYQGLLRKNPNSAAAYCGLGLVHHRNNDLGTTIENYSRALQLQEQPIVYHQRACAYLDKGDYHNALQDCQEAVRLDPRLNDNDNGNGDNVGSIQLTIAQCHEGLGQWKEAVQAYSTYLVDSPKKRKRKEEEEQEEFSKRSTLHLIALISVHLHRARCRRQLFQATLLTNTLSSFRLSQLLIESLDSLPTQLEDLLHVLKEWERTVVERLSSNEWAVPAEVKELLKGTVNDLVVGLELGASCLPSHAHLERGELTLETHSESQQLVSLLRSCQ